MIPGPATSALSENLLERRSFGPLTGFVGQNVRDGLFLLSLLSFLCPSSFPIIIKLSDNLYILSCIYTSSNIQFFFNILLCSLAGSFAF